MSAVLILAPVIISSWPAISAAVAGAAVALGLTVKSGVEQETVVETEQTVEVELKSKQEISTNLQTDQEVVLQKGSVTIRVKRDARGRCMVCATGRGKTDAELKEIAQEFTDKLTQTYVYNRVMQELRAKGFQVTNEEVMQDETVRLNVRHYTE